MREPKIITRDGISFIYVDFSNMKTKEEIFDMIEKSKRKICYQRPKSVLVVTNLSNMYFNTEIFNAITQYAKGNAPFVKASAVIGLGGLMQIFYNSFLKISGRDVRAFNSEEEAISYLQKFKTETVSF